MTTSSSDSSSDPSVPPNVLLRYWAGARHAAGVEQEPALAATLAEALETARAQHDAEFARVLGICSFLVDEQPVGTRDLESVALVEGSVVDVLPPFAGG
ncbi:MAG: MoaD/ThiS family protein [Actinomycetes bacterium]